MKTIIACTLVTFATVGPAFAAADVPPPKDVFERPVSAAIEVEPEERGITRAKQNARSAQAEARRSRDVRREIGASSVPGVPAPPYGTHISEDAQVAWTAAVDGETSSRLADDIREMVMRPARMASSPLIIADGGADAGNLAKLNEDLAVMTRILSKAVDTDNSRSPQNWAMGIVVTTLGGPRMPQSIYLDGYGALFMLNARYPLVAPETAEPVKEPEAETDSEWEDAKAEVLGRRNANRARVKQARAKAAPEYDATQVENMKHMLIDALKSARNIRGLKPTDWITVVVTGSDGLPGPQIKSATSQFSFKYNQPGPGYEDVLIAHADKPTGSESSQMVVRIKKSEVDAFANASLTADEFAKRVQINTR